MTELLERLRDPAARELEVRRDGVRVKVSKPAPAPEAAIPPEARAEAPTRAEAPEAGAKPERPTARAKAREITAPLTGIFYRSPSAQAPPFVQVGTAVSIGDIVGLIEAMKLFNEVRAPASGRVRRVAAENGQLVRAHQALFELE